MRNLYTHSKDEGSEVQRMFLNSTISPKDCVLSASLQEGAFFLLLNHTNISGFQGTPRVRLTL